jgi:hypothetical protein
MGTIFCFYLLEQFILLRNNHSPALHFSRKSGIHSIGADDTSIAPIGAKSPQPFWGEDLQRKAGGMLIGNITLFAPKKTEQLYQYTTSL